MPEPGHRLASFGASHGRNPAQTVARDGSNPGPRIGVGQWPATFPYPRDIPVAVEIRLLSQAIAEAAHR
jgi:hypothetical protein